MKKILFTLITEDITDKELKELTKHLLDTARVIGKIKAADFLDKISAKEFETELDKDLEGYIAIGLEDGRSLVQRVEGFTFKEEKLND